MEVMVWKTQNSKDSDQREALKTLSFKKGREASVSATWEQQVFSRVIRVRTETAPRRRQASEVGVVEDKGASLVRLGLQPGPAPSLAEGP